MTSDNAINRLFTRHPSVASLLYLALVAGLLLASRSALTDLYQQRQEVVAARFIMDQLNGRKQNRGTGLNANAGHAGSPFLEGQTVTIAGAALLQRVADAVTRVGSSVLSSQVDVDSPKSKQGQVSLIVSCEVAESELQKLLYDLEAGMPYLFLDQVVVQAPDRADRAEGGRLRVLLGVSGQWQPPK